MRKFSNTDGPQLRNGNSASLNTSLIHSLGSVQIAMECKCGPGLHMSHVSLYMTRLLKANLQTTQAVCQNDKALFPTSLLPVKLIKRFLCIKPGMVKELIIYHSYYLHI